MTIPSYNNQTSSAGNGITTVFSFPPPFTANTDLVVQIQAADGTLTTKTLATDYTVTGAGNPAGGTVTMLVAPVTGTTLIIYRDVPITQPVTLLDGGPLPATTVNNMLDRITMWGQRLKQQVQAIGTLVTTTVDGLMSHTDKVKLDGIAAGAQVNTVTSVAGRTGAVTLAKADVGLGSVDNTSDAAKPVSTATQTALNAKANTADLSTVATSGSYLDLSSKPTLGTASSHAATDFATAAQGSKADSALQSVVPGTNITIDNTDPRNPIITASGEAGGGDVTGPASATDSHIALFDGATGKLLKDGGALNATNVTYSTTTVDAAITGLASAFSGLGSAASLDAGSSAGNVPVLGAGGKFTASLLPTIAANAGGTGQTVYAVGDLLYASTTTALSKLADVATGNALISGGVGVAPSWGKIGLTTHVSGTLGVANGGTGLTSVGTSGQIPVSNGTGFVMTTPSGNNAVPVRQTVLSGPVASGLPNFLPATSGTLSIASQNVSTGTNALVATAANGFGSSGAVDVIGVATSNLTWSSLTASTTNFLGVTISSGALTTFSTTAAPIYQYGGTISTTNGQYTFDIQAMQMYLGNGTAASAVNAVFLGECVTSSSGVTSSIAYAYQGYYDSGFISTLPGVATNVVKNSNLGIADAVVILSVQNLVAEGNFSVGDIITQLSVSYASGFVAALPVGYSRNTVWFTTGAVSAWVFINKTTGGNLNPTPARWAYRLTAKRPW